MEFGCSDCDYTSITKKNIKRHVNRKNKCGESNSIPYIIEIPIVVQCEHCEKHYNTKPSLKRHLKTCKVLKSSKDTTDLEQKIKELEQQNKELKQQFENLSIFIDTKFLSNTSRGTIRSQARRIYKKHCSTMDCLYCGEKDNTQVCHIKPISEFNGYDSLSDINSLANLIGFCANCHLNLDKHKKPKVVITAMLHSMLIRREMSLKS